MIIIQSIQDKDYSLFKSLYAKYQDTSECPLAIYDIDKIASFVLDKQLGKIIINEEKELFALIIDIGLFRNYKNDLNYLSFFNLKNSSMKIDKHDLIKDLSYITKEVYYVCPTTFYYITNISFKDMYEPFSPIKWVIYSYPTYNVITLSKYYSEDEEIEGINERRTYNFYSNLRHNQDIDDDVFYYNYLDRIDTSISENLYYYRISRYPDLLEFYDDYRNKTISMILPLDNPLSKMDYYKDKTKIINLKGFTVKDSYNTFFTSEIGGITKACFVGDVEFIDFFHLEQTVDLFNVYEGAKIVHFDDASYQCLFFWSKEYKEEYYVLQNKRPNKEDIVYEDEMIADIYTTIPIKYESLEQLEALKAKENNFIVNNVITGLRFQENYEFGNENHNVRKYQDRVMRFDLGSIYVYTAEESHYNYYRKTLPILSIEKPIPVRLMVTIDIDTHTGVLYMLNFGSKAKPSEYINSISGNNILYAIQEDDINNSYINPSQVKQALSSDEEQLVPYISLYSMLYSKFKIKKMGMPRHMLLSPFLGDMKETDSEQVKAKYHQIKSSLLYAETLYDDAEELGKIIHPNIDKLLADKYGQSVYDYSSTYISKATILQYGDTYKDYIIERIDFGVINLFYMELIVLEDAAVQIATSNISRFINSYEIKGTSSKSKNIVKADPKNIIDTFQDTWEEYAKTLDFWDIQMNFLTSKIFITSIRTRFGLQQSVKSLQRIRTEIEQIYERKSEKAQEKSGLIITIVGGLLTITNIVDIYEREYELVDEFGNPNHNLFRFEQILVENFSTLDVVRIALCVIILFLIIKYIIKRKDDNNINKK